MEHFLLLTGTNVPQRHYPKALVRLNSWTTIFCSSSSSVVVCSLLLHIGPVCFLSFPSSTLLQDLSLCCSGQRRASEMSTKAPIYLKRRSRKGKKEKLRDLLSSDMISPPLGDFRHTIHIGSGGGADDLFGDLSFLQGKFHLLPGQQGHQGPFQFNRTASVSASHPPANESSPLLKNALSLPVIGGVQALTLPAQAPATSTAAATVTTRSHTMATTTATSASLAPPPKPPRLHLESPHASLPASPNPKARSHGKEEEKRGRDESEDEERPYLSHAGSLLSLHLDLGPSILEEVLQIMDGQRIGGINGGFTANGRQEIYT